VTYTIDEGPQTRIAEVIQVGAQHTRRDYIDTTTDLQPGAPLSLGKLLESESRLYNTTVFDWVSVDTREQVTTQTEEDVLVKAHDAKRNSLAYGVGLEISPRTGNLPAGTVAVPGLPPIVIPGLQYSESQRQFVSPRGSVQYTRLNLRGKGETASIAGLVSRLDQRGIFTYADPHFRWVKWSSLLSASAERTSENPIFTARHGEASFQLERPWGASKTQRIQLRYRFGRTNLTNLLIPELVLPEDRSVRLSTFSATYIRDTRDKPLDAHHGFYQTLDLSITPEALGASASFARFFGQNAYYRQMKPWLVWANNVRLGLAKPFAGSEVPLSERFFSGGADSLRGFPVQGAGPQRTVPVCSNPHDTATCTTIQVPVGGNQLFILNSEARFPIPLKSGLGGVVFYDGGNVYGRISFRNFFNDYSNTIGFGLRYQTPVGPVRIDIGRNLSPIPGIKATQVFVSLGQAF
jgi:outer membrane protein assembly factor BamA